MNARNSSLTICLLLWLVFFWQGIVSSQVVSADSSGFDSLRPANISFENLPINAPPNLVAVIPSEGRNFILSPDDRWLLLSEGSLSQGFGQILNVRKLKLIDTKTWQQVAFSPAKAGRDSPYQFRAVFSPNGQLMFTASSSNSTWEHSLQLWDMSGALPRLIAFFHISSRLDKEVFRSWRHLSYSGSRTNIVSNSGRILISSRDRTALLSVEGDQLVIDVDAPVGGELVTVSEDFERVSFLKKSGELWGYEVNSDTLTGIRKTKIAQATGGGRIDFDNASVDPSGLALLATDSKRGACFWSRLGQESSKAHILPDPLSRPEQRKIYGRRALSADGGHFTLTDSDGEQTVTDVYDQSGTRVLTFSHELPVEYNVRVLPSSDCGYLLVSDHDDTTGYRLLIYRVGEQ
ncbi:MAG: hypothetical protein AAF483_22025 [Planctomycetota bacterium]